MGRPEPTRSLSLVRRSYDSVFQPHRLALSRFGALRLVAVWSRMLGYLCRLWCFPSGTLLLRGIRDRASMSATHRIIMNFIVSVLTLTPAGLSC